MSSIRVLIVAAGLVFAVVLAVALTLALPGSKTAQAQGGPPPFGAQTAEVTLASTVTFTVSNVYDVKATLNISGHATAWYYQANKTPDNTCKGPVTAGTTTKDLTGLAANTSYTYSAYSDSTCSTQVGSSVTFITKKQILTLVGNGRYTAALSLRGLNLNQAHVKGDAAPYDTCTKWSTNVDGDGLLQLTGLTANTDYTYRVYEDSGCATELAKIEFTTYGVGLTLSKLADTTATLKISEHTGKWYYQANKAPDNNTCTEVAAGTTTKDLTGLTAGTLYVYRAYSDSACATTRLASVQFRTKVTGATPKLTVSYVGPTTAKLTVSGHSEGGNWLFSADGYESGHCLFGGEAGDRSIVYLAGLTPGETYNFTAYYILNPTHFLSSCAFEMATVTFTTPAQLPQCDGLSLEVRVDPSRSSGEWFFNYIVSNNTATAIHDIRLHTSMLRGDFYDADLLNRVYVADHTITELQPYATVGETVAERIGTIVTQNASKEMNVIMQLMAPDDPKRPVCQTLADPIWASSLSGPVGITVRSGDFGISSMQLDNPLAGAGENATFTITAYASTNAALTQACVNLDFDGLTPVDADLDGHHDVVIYDGPNGKYQEDGTLNSGGFARAGRLEYDSDGDDEDRDNRQYRPQCSAAAGKFEGGLFRIGGTRIGTDSSTDKWPAGVSKGKTYYTVKVPVGVNTTGSGPGCVTATMGALPPEITTDVTTAYERSRDNTAKVCLGAPPAKDPSLPVLFQSGRADLLTLHKCTDGASFPCAGKSADDVVQYVDGSGVAAAGLGTGNAADNAGSPYRAFRATEVVTHVADLTKAEGGGRRINGSNKLVWWTGNDNAGDPNGIHPGVVGRYVNPGSAYSNYKLSICDEAASTYATTPICKSTADHTTPGSMKLLYTVAGEFAILNVDGTQPGWNSSLNDGLYRTHFEFGGLGTYVADSIVTATLSGSSSNHSDKATYTFHVGPAADLSVHEGGASASVASGKRAFTIVAESEATAEIDTEFEFTYGIEKHKEKVNLHTLIPAVTVTANDAVIPAANLSQVGATAGAYDKATGVWKLPEGWQGQAELTLVADASAVGSVKAVIENSAEVCENAAGVHRDVDNPGASTRKTSEGREACEWYLKADGTREQDTSNNDKPTGYHWGAYQRCIKTDASAVGLDRKHANSSYIAGETACTTNAATNTWHTTEVYDWRPQNNEVTFTPSAYGFGLSAGPGDRASIDLSWSRQSEADSYAIYSVSAASLSSPPNLGALLSVNQLDVVSGDVTRYSHDGLDIGETRYYLVRARKDGRPYAMSGVAGATARTPVHTYTDYITEFVYVRPAGPEVVSATARGQGAIELSWSGPESLYDAAVEYYEVEYSTDGVNWHTLVAETRATDYAHRGLTPGTTWHYRVYAHNAQGHSLRSVQAKATTDAGSLATLSLSTMSPEVGAPVQATLAFGDGTAPAEDGVTWQWQRYRSGASDWTDIAGATGASYTPVSADEAAWLRAVATYPDPTYPEGLLTARSLGKFVYVRPVGVTAEGAWPQGIRLSWSGPGLLYDAPVEYYEIEASADGVLWGTLVPETTGTEYVHDWPTAGSTWHYRVYAHNAEGRSLSSAPVVGTGGGLTADADGLNRIYLDWPRAEWADFYEVEYSNNGATWQRLATGLTATEYVDATLTAGETRYYRVHARDAAGRSAASAEVSATTLAGIGGAYDVSASVNADGSVTLAWTAGENANIHAFGGQRATEDGIDNGSYSPYGYADELEEHTIPAADLISGAWTFLVLAGYQTRDGAGTWTRQRPIPSVAVEVLEPGPTALTAMADGPANVILAWAPPAGTFYELPAEYFEVEYSTDGATWQQLATNVVATTYTDAGLAPAETRHYRVYAHNARGRSLASEAASATTIRLGAAADVSAVLNEDGTVTVSWTPGANANLHFVAGLRRNAAGAYDHDNMLYVPASSPDSHTLDVAGLGLLPGTYFFTVQSGYESADGTRTLLPDPALPFAELELK